MKTITIISCIILCFVSACSTTDNKESVYVDIDPKRKVMDSTIFTDREVIFLDCDNPESLLRGINVIDLYKDVIYVYDKPRMNLLTFSKDGSYLSKIGRIGQGPGEYVRMCTFCIDRDNEEIIISTDTPSKIMFFSLSGKFIAETKTDDTLYEIVKKGNNLYSSLIINDKYEFAIYTLENHSVKSVKYCETPERTFNKENRMQPPGIMLLMSKSDILFTRTFDNTIYKIANERLVPHMVLDFGKYNLSNVNTLDNDAVRSKIFNDRMIYGITNAKSIGGKIIFCGQPNGIFVAESNNSAQQYGKIIDSRFLIEHNENHMTPVLDPESNIIAFTHQANDFKNLVAINKNSYTDEIVKLISNIDPEDNPIIFLYKLKK